MRIALAHSARDLCCNPEDFLKNEPIVTDMHLHEGSSSYYSEPFAATLVSYGSNIVAGTKPEHREAIEAYLARFPEHFHNFETPNIYALNESLMPKGFGVCFMAEYFLPDVSRMAVYPCRYETKVLTQPDFQDMYEPEWSNALCEKRKHLDVLGVCAYDAGKPVGFAACSADAENMLQIGVDVLPEYRRQGIGAAVTSQLAQEILNRGKVPFYCAAWSNVRSVRNAIKCGFMPGWVEITLKPISYIADIISDET